MSIEVVWIPDDELSMVGDIDRLEDWLKSVNNHIDKLLRMDEGEEGKVDQWVYERGKTEKSIARTKTKLEKLRQEKGEPDDG